MHRATKILDSELKIPDGKHKVQDGSLDWSGRVEWLGRRWRDHARPHERETAGLAVYEHCHLMSRESGRRRWV